MVRRKEYRRKRKELGVKKSLESYLFGVRNFLLALALQTKKSE